MYRDWRAVLNGAYVIFSADNNTYMCSNIKDIYISSTIRDCIIYLFFQWANWQNALSSLVNASSRNHLAGSIRTAHGVASKFSLVEHSREINFGNDSWNHNYLWRLRKFARYHRYSPIQTSPPLCKQLLDIKSCDKRLPNGFPSHAVPFNYRARP